MISLSPRVNLLFLLAFLGLLSNCSEPQPVTSRTYRYTQPVSGETSYTNSGSTTAQASQTNAVAAAQRPKYNTKKINKLYHDAKVNQQLLSRRSRSRSGRPMRPRYITIHSTQNYDTGADAMRHALALRNGALGKIGWHYTVDENRTVQHLPTTEQGNHAENYLSGTGNRSSIGIEMCENPGNSKYRTMQKTAKLAAYLMHQYNLPISRVVPHYRWPRPGYARPNKNCPIFLMDSNGRPEVKWQRFLDQVQRYHDSAKY